VVAEKTAAADDYDVSKALDSIFGAAHCAVGLASCGESSGVAARGLLCRGRRCWERDYNEERLRAGETD
jgi:hypothetical protein